jgi:23S rRNA pseudouridine2605 synthase
MEERLQKILAQAGFGSRRSCEGLITEGRVRVNGATAVIGQKADPGVDKITVDGKPVRLEEKVYVALNKPRFVLSVVETERGDTRQTVRDLVPLPERLYPVGRLDFESEGLVLMTNDGDLANLLTHPKHGHEKEYRVLVARHPEPDQLNTWRRGVVLEDGYKTAPAELWVEGTSGKGAWLRVVMKEGRKRQIREIGGLLGLPIVRIVRVRIGTLRLGTLKPKEWRRLTPPEVVSLRTGKEIAGEPSPTRTGRPPARKPPRPKKGR